MGDTFDVSDITAESVKKWTPSVVCKWVVSTAMEEDIGKHFVLYNTFVQSIVISAYSAYAIFLLPVKRFRMAKK